MWIKNFLNNLIAIAAIVEAIAIVHAIFRSYWWAERLSTMTLEKYIYILEDINHLLQYSFMYLSKHLSTHIEAHMHRNKIQITLNVK